MNKIVITGYLGQDPEMQTLSNGMEKKWFRKGSGIVVIGRMESSQSEKDGQKRTYWSLNVDDIEFPMGGGSGRQGETADAAAQPVDEQSGMPVVETDELPF